MLSSKNLNLILSKLDALLAAQSNDDDQIIARLKAIAHNLGFLTDQVNNANIRLVEVLDLLLQKSITDFNLTQIQGDTFMAITGVVVGTTGTFQIGFVPSTNFVPLPTPPTVASSDSLVILSPVDTNFQFKAAVDPSDTATVFTVTVSGTNDKGAALSHTFSIPILPTPPPAPVSITDFSLDQVS